jgi:hypothetical protein
MTKPLNYYCSSPEDEPIFRRIQEAIEKMLAQHKLEIALLSLHMYVRRNSRWSFTPGVIEEVTLVNQLSPSGKLALVHALIEQARDSAMD